MAFTIDVLNINPDKEILLINKLKYKIVWLVIVDIVLAVFWPPSYKLNVP